MRLLTVFGDWLGGIKIVVPAGVTSDDPAAERPEMRDALIADLQTRADLIVEPINESTIEVSLLGSCSLDAMRLAIYLRVRAWKAAQRAAGQTIHVELL